MWRGMWGSATAAKRRRQRRQPRQRPTFVCSFLASHPPPSFSGCLLPFLDASDPPSRAPASSLTARSVCDAPDDAHDDDSPTSAFVPLASHLHPLPSPSMLPSPWVGRVPRSLFGCRVPHPFLDASIHFWMPSALLCPFSFFVAFRPGLSPYLDASILIWMPSALDPDSPSPPSLFGCFTSFALLDDATYLCAHLLSCSLRSSDHLPYRVTFHTGSPSLTQILGSWPTQS